MFQGNALKKLRGNKNKKMNVSNKRIQEKLRNNYIRVKVRVRENFNQTNSLYEITKVKNAIKFTTSIMSNDSIAWSNLKWKKFLCFKSESKNNNLTIFPSSTVKYRCVKCCFLYVNNGRVNIQIAKIYGK